MIITIKDIAKYAGVSVGTVSKVLNSQGNVKQELKLRVEAVVEKFNFRPSSLARGMKINKTNTIGLIIPKITNSFYVKVIEYIEKEVNDRNYTLVLGNSNEDVEREINCIRTFSNMRIDGLILASTGISHAHRIKEEISACRTLNIPVVLISRRLPDIDEDIVELENEEGSYQAIRFLIENGHRRVAIISSSTRTSASPERIKGYLRALEEFKIPYEMTLVREGGLTLDSGYQVASELLSLPKRPSAIFIGSNFQLLGTLRALKENRVKVPEEMSLICFDDTEWCSYTDPPLTVIEPDSEHFSGAAVEFLFDRIQGGYMGKGRRRVLPARLVKRKSVINLNPK